MNLGDLFQPNFNDLKLQYFSFACLNMKHSENRHCLDCYVSPKVLPHTFCKLRRGVWIKKFLYVIQYLFDEGESSPFHWFLSFFPRVTSFSSSKVASSSSSRLLSLSCGGKQRNDSNTFINGFHCWNRSIVWTNWTVIDTSSVYHFPL